MWYSFNDDKFDEYRFLTEITKSTTGTILKVNEFVSDIESKYEGAQGASDNYISYEIEYEYEIHEGKKLQGTIMHNGEIPFELKNIHTPKKVEIEYLEETPYMSRIRNLKNDSKTLWEWYCNQMILPSIILVIASIAIFYFCLSDNILRVVNRKDITL
jgi:hypothetical protein